MTLIALAVVGKENEPLYLRDFNTELSSCSQQVRSEKQSDVCNDKNQSDPFGFFDSEEKKMNESCSLNNQVRKGMLLSIIFYEPCIQLTETSNCIDWNFSMLK